MNHEFYTELARRFSSPVQLYHGTSSKFIPSILKHGLKADNRNSVWEAHNTRPDRFTLNGRGRGPTFPGVYAANKVVGARQYASESKHKHGGNPTYVEIQSHNRELHPDDDALAHALVRSHENSPHARNLMTSLKHLSKRDRKEGIGRKLIHKSREDFANHVLENLHMTHKHPETLKRIRPLIDKVHDSGQKLHYLDLMRDRAATWSSFKDDPEERKALKEKAQKKIDSLAREHTHKYRAAMKNLSDSLTWDKHHDIDNDPEPMFQQNRILHEVGYKGRTHISGVHELEPDEKNPGEKWIKTHYSTHKDSEGNMVPSMGFMNSAHRAGYTIKGIKNHKGQVVTEF